MKLFIICSNCGNIFEYNDRVEDGFINHHVKCTCNSKLSIYDHFPTLASQDFYCSARDLYEKSKQCDRDNLAGLYDVLIKYGLIAFDKTKLDSYLNRYEKIKEKYQDNDASNLQTIMNEFEKIYIKSEKVDIIDHNIILSILSFNKNRFRKPFIIMTLSLIEQLFNDYFTQIIKTKLSSHGADNFLKTYETNGIQNCINILDSFLDEPLTIKMDRHYRGYYDKWDTYRKVRNEIIHSNKKYVSKIRVTEIYKFIDISVELFAKLKSEIYKNAN